MSQSTVQGGGGLVCLPAPLTRQRSIRYAQPWHVARRSFQSGLFWLRSSNSGQEPVPAQPAPTKRRRSRAEQWRLVRAAIMIGVKLIRLLFDVRAGITATTFSSKIPRNILLTTKTEKQLKALCPTLQVNKLPS